MSTIVLLDASPLGLVANPNRSKETQECNLWLNSLTDRKIDVRIPEIADYEVRRELIRANKLRGVERLNEFKLILDYVPLTTQTMLKAAQFWADVRKQGLPTADNKALDGDVILAAQAAMLENGGYTVIIATTNVRHLSRFTTARERRDIS